MTTNTKCPECGDEQDTFTFDPFGFGNLLDQHIDTEIEEDELSERVAKAMEMARKIGGSGFAGIEDELAELTKPRLTWQDFVRDVQNMKRRAGAKNNWNVPKRRQLLAGLYSPTKIDYVVKILCAIDTSASMTIQDISFGVSQIQALAERCEGQIVCWDTMPYWQSALRIKTAKPDELRKLMVKGRGGTHLMPLLNSYQAEIGDVDIVVVISDFELMDINEAINYVPANKTQFVWLGVGRVNREFKPRHGRKFELNNE